MSRGSDNQKSLRSRIGALAVTGLVIAGFIIGVQIRPEPVDRQTRQEGVEVPAAVAATDTRPARAAVDESTAWGLEIEGIHLRAEPMLEAPRLESSVVHGESHEIVCWVDGERITNGNDQNPTDDATTFTSTLWWKVRNPQGDGLISNVWFARTVDDKLGAPPC